MRIVKKALLTLGFILGLVSYAAAQGAPNIQNWTAQPGYANSIQQQINNLIKQLGPAPSPGNAGFFLMSNGTIANYYAMSGDISCSTTTPGLCTISSTAATSLLSVIISNEAATGTTLNKLVKLTGAPSTAIISATTDTNNAIGICNANCGTAATAPNATIKILGLQSCVFDGATTAGDSVTISTTTAGDCHDTGSTSPPNNPQEALGYVLSTNGSGGTYTMYLVNTGSLGGAVQTSFLLTNNSGTGTTLNKLVKFTGAPSKGTITATTDTNNAIGICTGNCGTSGQATIQYEGSASCVFDGATTAGDFVTISSTTGGDCHDTGSSSAPTNGAQPVGIVLSTNGGGGTYNMYFSTINGALLATPNALQALLVPNRVTTSGATLSVNLSTSINQFISLHDTITLSFSAAPPDGYVVRFKLTQTNGGSHTVTWPASVQWPSGSAPVLTLTNGQADWVQCVYDGTTTNYNCSSLLNFVP